MTTRTLRPSALTLLLAFLLALLWLVAAARPAQAAGVVGNGTPASCDDNAINTIFAAGSGTITFNCGAAPLTISANTRVIGAGQNYVFDGNNKITLDGEDLRQLFIVSSGGTLTLRNIALTRGGFGNGSVVYNNVNGDVTLRNVTIEESGEDAAQGGAIYNAGLLEVELSYFRSNSARQVGGAIYNGTGATLSVRNSTFLGNKARHPVLNLGDGGGVFNAGALTIDGSTFYANDAKRFGGGLYTAQAATTIVNSTFAENRAGTAGSGGAIYSSNTAVNTALNNVTIERNNADVAGGIWNGGTVRMGNTIVANSSVTADNGTPSLNCDGPSVISDGHNLIGDNSCVNGSDATDLRSVNPNLSFINPNGGPTDTLLPLIGSPAIDTGDNGSCAATDQRGVARPVGSACDIGAVEWRLIDVGGSYLPIVKK